MRPCPVLFVMNFPPGTGYAWGTIQAVIRRVCGLVAKEGMPGVMAFPAGGTSMPPVAGEGFRAITLDYAENAPRHERARALVRVIRDEGIRVLYLTDQPTWSFWYLWFRVAGVSTILVHDRTSGDRRHRVAGLGLIKRLVHRVPWLAADRYIGVSDFVVRRLIDVSGTPAAKTTRVYNGIELSRFEGPIGATLHQVLGLPPTTSIVFASGRAAPYKGIGVLIEAAARLARDGPADLHFAYAGDGPSLADFKAQVARLGLTRFHFLGKRDDVPDLLRSATIAVVPSVWAEAFGLTVAEAMAAGMPLVATATGGIPELVIPGETGLLVPPNDPVTLAGAILDLIGDPPRRRRLGSAARASAFERFSVDRVAHEIGTILLDTRRG